MSKLIAYIKMHKRATIGALLGAAILILMFTIGFWRTILLAVAVAIGIWIGSVADKRGGFKNIFKDD